MRPLLRANIYFVALLGCIDEPQTGKSRERSRRGTIVPMVHDSTYTMFYKFYRDCSGGAEPDSVMLCYSNSCNSFSGSVYLQKVTNVVPPGIQPGGEVPINCTGTHTTCTAPGSLVPGYREWWYSANVTLPMQCSNWKFSAAVYSRVSGITNISNPGSQYLYSEATLDNLHAQGSTSPFFSTRAIIYSCANVPVNYTAGAYDINNDSLVYSLIDPMSGSGCPASASGISFQNASPPYNLNAVNGNPIQCNNSFLLDVNSGMMSFIPSDPQIGTITMRVDKYRNQQKIGSVMRDIQVDVFSCNAGQPNINTSNFNWCYKHAGVAGAADTIFSVPYVPMSFDVEGYGNPVSDYAVVSSNSTSILLGSTFNYNTSLDTAKFGWMASILDTGNHYITLYATDTNCSTNYGISPMRSIPVVIRILAIPNTFGGCYSGALDGGADSSDIGVFSIGSHSFGVGGTHLNNAAAVRAYVNLQDTVDLLTDNSYVVSLSDIIKTSSAANAKVSLFIDYNNNQHFDIPNERVWSTYLYPGNDTPKVILNVPHAYVTAGSIVQARLILNNNTGMSAASDSGCGVYMSGETEDFMIRFQNPSSVITEKAGQGFEIYPNPNSGKFVVRLKGAAQAGSLQIKVSNVTGQIIWSKSYENPRAAFSETLDLSDVAKGIYFIEVDKDGVRQVNKIVIQ